MLGKRGVTTVLPVTLHCCGWFCFRSSFSSPAGGFFNLWVLLFPSPSSRSDTLASSVVVFSASRLRLGSLCPGSVGDGSFGFSVVCQLRRLFVSVVVCVSRCRRRFPFVGVLAAALVSSVVEGCVLSRTRVEAYGLPQLFGGSRVEAIQISLSNLVVHFLRRVDFCVLSGMCFVGVSVLFLRSLAAGGLLIVVVCGCQAEGWGVRRSIHVVVMQVDLVACFDLFVFELVHFALLFRLFAVFDFGIELLVGRVFGQVKVSALVVRELRGAFLTSVWSLVGRSLLIRGREQVCDSGPFRLL
ncbi:transmembrane protein, putative [Medicago truncatula]|uniref:Transmembrane protein, putative n=1 Tax=Medicago truncatula TaxID=3880 RepID=G7J5L0_MEDTR|nr:transmembrane protein, putative [Medicago truncatula]